MDFKDYADRFELDKALERFCGDKELLCEAIAIYKEEAKKHLETIETLLQTGDLQKASLHAHTLKGESGTVGAKAAQFASDKLEKATKNNELKASQELYRKVTEEANLAFKCLPETIEQI